jgi:hypothetical protein
MAGQRVSREAAAGRALPAGRKVVQFEARIGNLYLTRMGRVCKLLRIEPATADRPDRLLGFGYVDEHNVVLRQGPTVDGFDMHERVASRLLTRVGQP